MIYLTGIHALNLPCQLNTCGDWHTSALKWENLSLQDSEKSIYKNYGIDSDIHIPEHKETYFVANHIRALLDLLEKGYFSVAGGMNEDFICNSDYDNEIFEKVLLLKNSSNWKQIDEFMGKEYHMKWVNFKRKEKINRYGLEN